MPTRSKRRDTKWVRSIVRTMCTLPHFDSARAEHLERERSACRRSFQRSPNGVHRGGEYSTSSG